MVAIGTGFGGTKSKPMDRSNRRLRTGIVLLGDIVGLYLALFVTIKIRYGGVDANLWWEHVGPFTAVFAVWLAVFGISRLYDLSASGGRAALGFQLLGAMVMAGTIAAAFFYLGHNRLFTLRPQKVLILVLTVSGLTLYVWRMLLMAVLRSPRLSRRVLFVGVNPLIQWLMTELTAKPQLGYTPAAWVQTNGEPLPQFDPPKSQTSAVPSYRDVAGLATRCQRHGIDLIVSGISPRHHATLLGELMQCLPLKIDFSDLSTFYERITGKVPVDAIEQVWFLENLQEGTKKPYEFIKWLLDVALAAVLLLVALPMMPLLYAVVKLSSPGRFLFTQTRVGAAGRKFRAMKIRTMVMDAERHGPQWASRDDSRITAVGLWLRRTRLDEIPQLVNVLRGEMSLIGPRPERPEFIEQLKQTIPFYEERLLVKPGLTGWAQVNFPYGATAHDALEKLQYDLFYIKHRSLGLDFSIMLRTIGTMVSHSGR